MASRGPVEPLPAGTVWPYLYTHGGQRPLQWRCGDQPVWLHDVPNLGWLFLVGSKLDELSKATGQRWYIAGVTDKAAVVTPTGRWAPPEGIRHLITWSRLDWRTYGIVGALTWHTIDAAEMLTSVTAFNLDVTGGRDFGSTLAAINVMHEEAHMAGLAHRDDDPHSATTQRPDVDLSSGWTGHLDGQDRAALAGLGCAR
ncbi:MAG: hypothetical protein JWO68_2880 [Actinomycetia bacterium]|nr:hypothetical protein [Actinomycetes bacterium]